MDMKTRHKWDTASRIYNFMTFADNRRFGPYKQRLFNKMEGATLMVGLGTGNDIQFFPPNRQIIAIDISGKMLEKAAGKAAAYPGSIEIRAMDVHDLNFPDATFDTVVTACTFCSVPKPVVGLRKLYHALKPNGQILMFEHVRSRIGAFGIMLDLMTPITRGLGPDLNRDTIGNVREAGFRLRRVENVYLDIVKMIEAVKS